MLQFALNSAVLSAATGELNRVINHKTSMPILEGFKVSMDASGRIVMEAQDGVEYCMTKTLQADRFTGMGAFVADARQLTEALKGLPEQDITLDYEGKAIRIQYQGGEVGFEVKDAEDFPDLGKKEDGTTDTTLTGKTLTEGIARVQYAVAHNDQTRPIMSGVYMESQEGVLTFVGTDGRMLTYTEHTQENADFAAILPEKLCNILRATVKTSSPRVSIGQTYIYFEYGNTRLASKVIEGRYPNYRGVVPQNNPYRIEIDKATLLTCVKRVGAFANSASQLLRIEYSAGQLRVTGRDIDLFGRNMTETVAVKRAWASEGDMPDQLAIGLSAQFLSQVLSNLGADVVELQIADPSRPVVFVGDSATSLLMPMLLDKEAEAEAEEDEPEDVQPIEDEDEPEDEQPVEDEETEAEEAA